MKTRIQKWGNSLALRIPRAYAAEVEMEQASLVDLSVENGALVIRLVPTGPPSLDDLLAGITDANLHHEVDLGPPVGVETW